MVTCLPPTLIDFHVFIVFLVCAMVSGITWSMRRAQFQKIQRELDTGVTRILRHHVEGQHRIESVAMMSAWFAIFCLLCLLRGWL